MTPIELKLQCLSLANGDVITAKGLLDWLMEPMPAVDAARLATPLPAPLPGSQPEIQPTGAPRR